MSSEVRLIENWRERWEPVTKNGHTVLAVAYTGNEIQAWLTDNKGAWTCNQYNLTRKPRPKTYRPWKLEEVPVGSVVRSKNGQCVNVITSATGSYVGMGSIIFTQDEMLDGHVLHDLNPDGTWKPVEQCRPCGVEE